MSTVIIAGGGLVGSLSACFMAKRGHKVQVLEYRGDPRNDTKKDKKGRSVNLALSLRGLSALSKVGLDQNQLKSWTVPMYGRMIHPSNDGQPFSVPYGPDKNHCILSISRNQLNAFLLDEAEKNANVEFMFDTKIVNVDLGDSKNDSKSVKNDSKSVKNDSEKVKIVSEVGDEFKADFLLACDGCFSTIRRQLYLKQPGFEYTQSYIDHGYIELHLNSNNDNNYQMSANFLHVWPRGDFMLIALPNVDASFTMTLFMRFEKWRELDSNQSIISFFEHNFKDAMLLLGKDSLLEQFSSTKPSHMMSVKCSPYNITDKCLLLGDAAHAMVPFYGQGMNCGMEDLLILDDFLDKYDRNLAFAKFSQQRSVDAQAMVDLAHYNYIEMRELVATRTFRMRKTLDLVLSRILGKKWIPLYTSVTFSRMRYSECVSNRKWQDKIVNRCISVLGFGAALGFCSSLYYYSHSIKGAGQETWNFLQKFILNAQ